MDCKIDRFFCIISIIFFVLLLYIQIWLIIKTAYLLEEFKPHLKIFEFKIVKVEIALTKARSTRHGSPWCFPTFK